MLRLTTDVTGMENAAEHLDTILQQGFVSTTTDCMPGIFCSRILT